MNQTLLNELLAMKQRDQEIRSRLLAEGRLYGNYADEMQQVHIENARRLSQIIMVHSWPGISLVGLEGCRAAWFIAQHSICTPEEQRDFLKSLKQASEQGDAPKRLVALLTDRIRYNENRPQVYGTVFDWNKAGELSCDIEDPDTLEVRRAEVGLPIFEEDLVTHRNEVLAEGGMPPADFAEYERRKLNWAKSVGWI